eukprot:1150527-Pelagomonas_calceolata.AAC.6
MLEATAGGLLSQPMQGLKWTHSKHGWIARKEYQPEVRTFFREAFVYFVFQPRTVGVKDRSSSAWNKDSNSANYVCPAF